MAPNDDSILDNLDTESNIKETIETVEKQARTRRFAKAMEEAAVEVRGVLDENLDVEEEAIDMASRHDETPSKQDMKEALKLAVEQEVNSKKQHYRSLIYNSLKQHNVVWQQQIGKDDMLDKIDDLIETSVEVWTDQHLDEFADKVDEETDTSPSGITIALAVSISYGVIERVASDVVTKYGGKVVSWFLDNTSLTVQDMIEVLTAFFRGLMGV